MGNTNASKIKKIMHVLNPLAGKGTAAKIKENLKSSEYVYMSSSPDEATEFIKNSCIEDPDTCFTVYGGDGTVFKAVNALMESGNNKRASLKIVPVGSGNDFVAWHDSGAGMIPSAFAKRHPAAKVSFCSRSTASIYPSFRSCDTTVPAP